MLRRMQGMYQIPSISKDTLSPLDYVFFFSCYLLDIEPGMTAIIVGAQIWNRLTQKTPFLNLSLPQLALAVKTISDIATRRRIIH